MTSRRIYILRRGSDLWRCSETREKRYRLYYPYLHRP